MTSVCDTRFLITFRFPPTEDVKMRVTDVLARELAGKLLLPTIVMTEYVKIAGSRVGFDSAQTHIFHLEERGAKVVDINSEIALEAGRILLKHRDMPTADALIAATATVSRAEYVLTDDPHFKEMGVKTSWI